jgi:hypothetical protein
MRLVILETPYASDTPEGVAENVAYARACLRDCLQRGEAPLASHLLYTQPGVLDDSIAAERELGIRAGLDWGEEAQATVVYVDRGVSAGMEKGIAAAKAAWRTVEYRRIHRIVEFVITDFELNEQVFVPAGDGDRAHWKRKGDLTLGELARHVQGLRDEGGRQMKQVEQYDGRIPFFVNKEEEAKERAEDMALEAWTRERKKRQAAIDQDIAAGRWQTWSPVMTEKDKLADRWSAIGGVAHQLEEAVEFLNRVIDCVDAADR